MEENKVYQGSLEDRCKTASKLIRDDPMAAVMYLANLPSENLKDLKPAYIALKESLESRYARGQAEHPDEAKAYMTSCLLEYVNQKLAEFDGKDKQKMPNAGPEKSYAGGKQPQTYKGKPEEKRQYVGKRTV